MRYTGAGYVRKINNRTRKRQMSTRANKHKEEKTEQRERGTEGWKASFVPLTIEDSD